MLVDDSTIDLHPIFAAHIFCYLKIFSVFMIEMNGSSIANEITRPTNVLPVSYYMLYHAFSIS